MMSRHDPRLHGADAAPKLFCDLTQSWSEQGGGVRTYLLHKRRHILEATPHRHLMIIPGGRDEVIEEGRAVTVTVKSPHVPGSANYRLLLRNSKVREALERFRPDLIECQDAYNLPWAAIAHAKQHPETALVAMYCTDFPTTYVERPLSKVLGRTIAGVFGRACYRYCGNLYRRFDALLSLSENGGAAKLRELGIEDVAIVPLGVEVGEFGPELRDLRLRRSIGVKDHEPLLIYAGRLHAEKKPHIVAEAFQRLPAELNATLLLIGDGPQREQFEELGRTSRIITPGYVRDRGLLARWLASADIYVSGMADETFGVSIVEAQASGLPVVGVAAGAMIDRVTGQTGRLGPVDDADAMAANIMEVWLGDRKAMGLAASEHAHQFSWEHSMDALFRRIYPAALARSAERDGGGAGAGPAAVHEPAAARPS